MATKNPDALTLKDRLSRLTFLQAAKLLGENGGKLIRQGGKIEIDPMITHVLKLEEINKGFDLMHEGKSIRSVVVF